MQANLIQCNNLGMSRDKAISQLNTEQAEFAYDNRNIRITVNQGDTALSITNEKGTEKKLNIQGSLIGQCILNDQIILFVKNTFTTPFEDIIIKVTENQGKYNATNLYKGNLNFNLDYPIEALGYYESENVQKVYWVDGLNPNRFINIVGKIQPNNNTQFDCKGTIHQIPCITVSKDYSQTGSFPGGIIQYFATYYNKFGTETGIIWQSDLQYASMYERGCKESESATCVFKLNISNVDIENYEYLRIYATHRTSQNAQPLTYIVTDLETSTLFNGGIYIDDGIGLQSFATGDLNFIGGQDIIASTLDQKDDTLFLGDITLSQTIIPEDSDLWNSLRNFETKSYENDSVIIPNSCVDIQFSYKSLPTPEFKGTYAYQNQLQKSQINVAGFKHREIYRFGIQFQTSKGEWTNPIYIGDKYCDKYPKLEDNVYHIAQAQYTMNKDAVKALKTWNIEHIDNPFIQIRLLTAVLTPNDRRIIAQGVVNPTMFNYYDRIQNKPYSINSWMFRPRQSNIVNQHYDCMLEQSSKYAEIQGITEKHLPGFDPTIVSDGENSYALLIGLSGDWITTHDIAYVLYKFTNDGSVDFYEPTTDPEGNTVQIINDKQGRHNTLVGDPIVRTPIDDKGKKINFNSKDKARQWLLNNLAADLNMTDAMIPTAAQLKEMARASLGTNNPDLVWSIVGASIATVAMVALSVCTFGAGTGPSIAGIGAVWSGILGAIGTVGAAAGTAGIATLAKQLEDAPDVDKAFAQKGFYTLLPQFVHSIENKKDFKNQHQNWLDGLFRPADTNGNFLEERTITPPQEFIDYLNLGDNMATLVQQIGRTTFKTPKEIDAENKQEQYYVDESVVTLNSPDLEDNQYIIDNSKALRLDLVGTIPLTAAQGDVTMYTSTNGVSERASALDKLIIQPYESNIIEGLINGPLYQDIELKWNFNTTDNKWPDINPTVSVDSYKIFMWNRDTSWSCYIPGTNIINPMSISSKDNETKDYLNYIPALPKKKVIANLRYSHNTTYQETIHSLDIESPHIFTQGYDGITQFYSNDTYRTYYGNVDTLSLNTNGYVLLKGNDQPAWVQPVDSTYRKVIYDPISIKYSSTDHILIPLKWNKVQQILPVLNKEHTINLDAIYNNLSTNSIIEGVEFINKSEKFNLYKDYDCSILIQDVFNIDDVNGDFLICEATILDGQSYSHIGEVNILSTSSITIECDTFSNKLNQLNLYLVDNNNTETSLEDNIEFTYNGNSVVIELRNLQGQLVKTQTIHNLTNGDSITLDNIEAGQYHVYLIPTLSYKSKSRLDLRVDSDYTLKCYIQTNVIFTGNSTVEEQLTCTVNQDQIQWEETHPYLFVGELVRQTFDYNLWLGGTSDFALQQLIWNICSPATSITDEQTITNTWGDTYYQRWDCMKTFPTTDEDKNSVVDILSFMVETHINLDGRCDVNRGVNNLVNARPNNFNLLNKVYSQEDNIFQYRILDTKYEDNTQENQVVWSLTKTIQDDIDKWTQINTVNYLNLNGTYGRLRKIININGVLLAFQDTGLSTINYNQKAAMSTVEGIPVQLGNTNKVDGYTTVNDKIGCHNKWSINLNSTGLYFIDDYNQTLNRYSNEGVESISNIQGFSQWFKDNVNGTIWSPNNYTAFKLSFDELTKDLYIVNDTEALVYNTQLKRFTSFMDYFRCPLITNSKLNSIAIHQTDNSLIELYQMFAGDYNDILGYECPYWMTYRLNPSPYTDNMFTNFTYIADRFDSDNNLINLQTPVFDTVKAWNEYQEGELNLTNTKRRHVHSKHRFRIWHGDIPRDGDTLTTHVNGGDRMRNPWLYLKLSKDTTGDTNKMVFHNLTVTYYK